MPAPDIIAMGGCRVCGKDDAYMLEPHRLSYLFTCLDCGHEERIVESVDGPRWIVAEVTAVA